MQVYPLEKFYIYLSPYTAHAIVLDGIKYPTVEHAYQCQRYTDPKIIEEIRNASSPLKAREISSKYKHFQKSNFSDRKLDVMRKIMNIKVEQHEEIRQALIDSKDLDIVKHIVAGPPWDGFWDDGTDGKWLNHTGKIRMEIRAKLLSE